MPTLRRAIQQLPIANAIEYRNLLDYILSSRKENGNLPERPVIIKTIVTTEMAEKIADDMDFIDSVAKEEYANMISGKSKDSVKLNIRDFKNKKSGMAKLGDFVFFTGKPCVDLVTTRPDFCERDFMIMIPQNEEWAKLIEYSYGDQAKKVTRYATKKEPDVFDKLAAAHS